jgi:hypothetical protein
MPAKAPRIASGGPLLGMRFRPADAQEPARRFLRFLNGLWAATVAQGYAYARMSIPASRLATTTISSLPWVPFSIIAFVRQIAVLVGNRLLLPLNVNVAAPQVRSGILDLGPAIAADPVAKLEQRGVEIRSAARAGDGHDNRKRPR